MLRWNSLAFPQFSLSPGKCLGALRPKFRPQMVQTTKLRRWAKSKDFVAYKLPYFQDCAEPPWHDLMFCSGFTAPKLRASFFIHWRWLLGPTLISKGNVSKHVCDYVCMSVCGSVCVHVCMSVSVCMTCYERVCVCVSM